MNIKMLSFGAMALTMIGGSALAAGGDNTSAIDDPAMMQPFYTDSGMKTMRSDDEFKAAWMKMTAENQAAMTKACADDSSSTATAHPEFCSSVKKNGGNTN